MSLKAEALAQGSCAMWAPLSGYLVLQSPTEVARFLQRYPTIEANALIFLMVLVDLHFSPFPGSSWN